MSATKITDERKNHPIHLKVKIGDTEIEIECNEGQFNRTISSILSSTMERVRINPQQTVRNQRNATTCLDGVKQLIAEKWFKKSRTLPEVHEEMSRRGFNYGSGVIGHCLLDQVNKGLLVRKGRNRRYRYFQ